MAVAVQVFDDAQALGTALAADVLAALQADGLEEQTVLLGCPGGRSLRPTYRAMGEQAARDGLDLSRLVILMMDEYLTPSGTGFVRCDPQAHFSCLRFGHEQIRDVLNTALPPERHVRAANVWLPDPADPEAYDRRIADAGGIALFMLASGASDGHVAFNPPGTARNSRTHIVPLADTTRADNLRTFPDFRSLEEVPTHGVSVGIDTIASRSRRVVLVLTGEEKRQAAERVLTATSYDPGWPATVIHECRNARILLDRTAAGPDVR
jgi:glucosamine-6-phosphate deaminase